MAAWPGAAAIMTRLAQTVESKVARAVVTGGGGPVDSERSEHLALLVLK
ncbi:hypothetical protein GCM10010328_35280 [Streptomyces rubiginosohelvolus]|uniref:Uncharacterized protein n=1 Tax=Streptomyces rubiginosohelvolus TaxID=67362 RepID=A0ABQ3BZE3_9ACTN|nr:hypothetical protein GCM10010328_35280 [Streptomyces pluricolorescens]